MEILLLACLFAYTAGTQSEQARLGLTPADRAIRREQTRHEKAVRRIADKHGVTTDPGDSTKPLTAPKTNAHAPTTLPDAFRAGYRAHTPTARVTTPAGRRAGDWAAHGIAWARDTGKGALTRYRERRKAEGRPDPAPVLVPPPPDYAPTVGTTDRPTGEAPAPKRGVSLARPAPTNPAEATEAPHDTTNPAPESDTAAPDTEPATGGTNAPDTPTEAPETPQQTEGVGRMATEVTYESVRDESDEMSLLCRDDLRVYERIRERCEREIARGDELIAACASIGVTNTALIGKVTTCIEQYRMILGQLDELERNTTAQNEAVIKAKTRLEEGQGFYADIAADMPELAQDREFYTSDQVDSEDTTAHNDTYETQGAA